MYLLSCFRRRRCDDKGPDERCGDELDSHGGEVGLDVGRGGLDALGLDVRIAYDSGLFDVRDGRTSGVSARARGALFLMRSPKGSAILGRFTIQEKTHDAAMSGDDSIDLLV